jgi:hypothetical protein
VDPEVRGAVRSANHDTSNVPRGDSGGIDLWRQDAGAFPCQVAHVEIRHEGPTSETVIRILGLANKANDHRLEPRLDEVRVNTRDAPDRILIVEFAPDRVRR